MNQKMDISCGIFYSYFVQCGLLFVLVPIISFAMRTPTTKLHKNHKGGVHTDYCILRIVYLSTSSFYSIAI